jgi:hypothetical protein
MCSVAEMIRRLESVNIQGDSAEAIESTSADFARLNTAQMYQGLDSKGARISPGYRNPSYSRKKNLMNPTPGLGVPDLKLTGAFYRGLSIKVQDADIIIDSDVDYAKYLEANYTNIFYGLDEDSKRIYRDAFFEAFKAIIENKTQLSFD